MYCLTHSVSVTSVVPSTPVNVLAVVADNTSLLLMWDPPTIPNGIILYYRVEYFGVETTSTVNSSFYDVRDMTVYNVTSTFINDLVPFSTYNITVAAAISIGEGPPSSLVANMTEEGS